MFVPSDRARVSYQNQRPFPDPGLALDPSLVVQMGQYPSLGPTADRNVHPGGMFR